MKRMLLNCFALVAGALLVLPTLTFAQDYIPVPTPRPTATEQLGDLLKAKPLSVLPQKERACRSRLRKMGVRFKAVERIHGKGKCGIKYPLEIAGLPGGVKLSGRTVLNCRAGEALAEWTVKTAAPAAQKRFKSKLIRIDQYASYDCRTRNSKPGAKISQHSLGNAIDLGRFHMANGTIVDVASRPLPGMPKRRFMKTLRDAACTYFTTVLGPGSDVHHKDHFHFDIASRRNGYRYCK